MPAGCPLQAVVGEVRALGQLLMLPVAGQKGASLLVTAVAKVLARHANAGSATRLQIADAEDTPEFHDP